MFNTLSSFSDVVNKLSVFAPNVIEFKNLKEETRVFKLVDPIYEIQSYVLPEFQELKIDFIMARNDVIFKEILKDFAYFIAVFEEVRKYTLNLAKQEKSVLEYYNNLYNGYDHKTEWFNFIMEDIQKLESSFNSKDDKVPEDLSEYKKLFWNTHKEKRSQFRLNVLKIK